MRMSTIHNQISQCMREWVGVCVCVHLMLYTNPNVAAN